MSKAAGQIPLSFTHCAYCGFPFVADQLSFSTEKRRTRDHFIPRSKGGKNLVDNIYIVCQHCNFLKGDFLPNEFIYWLGRKIAWKEYPGINGFTFNQKLLQVVKDNFTKLYNGEIDENFVEKIKTVPVKQKDKLRNRVDEFINSGQYYCTYLGVPCPCVGYIDRALSNLVAKYQNAYYHAGEEKYVFVTKEHGTVAYYKKTISEFVKPYFQKEPKLGNPKGTDFEDCNMSVNTNTKVYPTKLKDIVDEALSAPQQNFHYL